MTKNSKVKKDAKAFQAATGVPYAAARRATAGRDDVDEQARLHQRAGTLLTQAAAMESWPPDWTRGAARGADRRLQFAEFQASPDLEIYEHEGKRVYGLPYMTRQGTDLDLAMFDDITEWGWVFPTRARALPYRTPNGAEHPRAFTVVWTAGDLPEDLTVFNPLWY